jgi:hypothetical protein
MMKTTLILAGLILSLAGTAIAQETHSESTQAQERIRMAHMAVPTTEQCLADLNSWAIRADSDEKKKITPPNWWFQKLSTEELERVTHEMSSCISLLRRAHHQEEMVTVLFYERELENELLNRAKEVLTDHFLMNEYLLKTSD